MREYIAKRLLLMVPTAILATLIVFTLMKIAPGDPASAILADLDVISQEEQAIAEEKIRREFGLDRPLPIQYIDWLGSVSGSNSASPSAVPPRPGHHVERLPRTMELAR